MSKFKYNLSDRVMVPGLDNVQGVVHQRTERTNKEPRYLLLYLDGECAPLGGEFDESAIENAQPVTIKLAADVAGPEKPLPSRKAAKRNTRKRR